MKFRTKVIFITGISIAALTVVTQLMELPANMMTPTVRSLHWLRLSMPFLRVVVTPLTENLNILVR
jgi:hypothetical protein